MDTVHKIIFSSDYLVNAILAVDWEGNPRKKIPIADYKKNPDKYIRIKRIFHVLEFYTKEGEFIASNETDEKIYFYASDRKGRLLALKRNEEDMQSIARYHVEIKRNY